MVAEGVETDLAYSELRRLGCDQAQGYFVCRPMPAAELNDWLTKRHAIDPTDVPNPPPSLALGRSDQRIQAVVGS
jgi:predicted signal transduction protein with EAL and GGDEF domain